MQYFYRVRSGDTVYEIAQRWEIPVASLIAANNLKPPYTIFPGQQLSIPPGVNVVRVKQGDTVFSISQLFGVPASVIIEANKLQPPYLIQVGQLLKVPPGLPYYTVVSGDTLYQIARRYNVISAGESNYELIRRVNRLPSYDLVPGLRLIIPYAPPGDQGLIAYFSDQSGEYDMWLYNPRDGVSQRLTNQLGELSSTPFWSPDSKKIAFVGKNRILFVIDIATRSVARIDQLDEGVEHDLHWSFDSSSLVYSKQNYIIMYHINSHQATSIIQSGATDIQWFPSGDELLFQAPDSAGVSQLYRIQTDGTRKRQITRNTNGPLQNVRLSPDGKYVLFTTPGVSISIIYTVELATGNLFEVRGGPLAKNYFPTWSPNSMRIAYNATAFDDRGYFSQIRTVGQRGQNDRVWAISNCFATPVTWSTNGRKVAYLSGCKEQDLAHEMWVIDLEHPVPIQLLDGVRITSLKWSPAPVTEVSRAIYFNSAYKVRFEYPSHWQKINNERYEGADGFFQIAAIAAGDVIDEVCQAEAYHQLMPYGSSPRIISAQVQNQEACFIFPSSDQPAEMRRQSALIVRYPAPVEIEGAYYNYFILVADEQHINSISETFKFL